jgi:enoyl-CoA hydratase/carnithine racemase
MPYKNLTFERKDHMGFIRLNAPSNDRIQIMRLSDELTAICSMINSDDEIRVIAIIGSKEGTFSIREDLSTDFSGSENDSQTNSYSLSEPIADLRQPVIAGIDGDAVGQGLEMALACDIRIGTETSRFGLPQIANGSIPSDGGIQRLARLAGRGKALEMVLTGEMIDAQEAARIGLINRIVPRTELEGTISDMALAMASKSPFSLKYAKESVSKGLDMTLEQGLRLEADLYFLLHTTEDRREGIEAFREKRTPVFKGR